MHEEIHEELKNIARQGTVICYGDLGRLEDLDMANPADRKRLKAILDDIDRVELSDGGPMLSAVAVNKRSSRPGPGFFTLARSLGLLTGGDEDAFYRQQLHKVHDHWVSH